MRYAAGLIALLLVPAGPAWGQNMSGIGVDPTLQQLPPPSVPTPTPRAGETADSVAGSIGVRQTRDQFDGADPIARIDNRIQNRVQARFRNRIDRDYDPRTNAASPFEVAERETQRSRQRQRR